MTVPNETAMGSGAATQPGAINQNGQVVVCPVGAATVSAMLAALGLNGATVIKNCNLGARATGAFVGPQDSGRDVFE
jgi:hypothetical protein